MKRVIQVVDSLNAGGAERVAVDLANGLSEAGYKVFFCVTRKEGALRKDLDAEIDFSNLRRKKSYQGLLRFRKIIKTNNISLIHAHGRSTTLFCVLALWGLRDVKIIYHDHSSLLKYRNNIAYKFIFKKVDAWVAVSKEIYNWVVINVKHSNILLMPNPIQVSRFHKSLNSEREIKRLVLLGNYREPKDYENLVNAIEILKGTNGARFTIACFGGQSDGDYFKKIKAMAVEKNLQNIITLNPSVSNVPTLLAESDIGVLSSNREGLPISLLEYMASYLPVVVTAVGECKRIVDEANCGIVVPPSSPAKLSNGIRTMLENQQRWEEWGLNGRNFIEENHSLNVFVKRIHDVYESVK